MAAGGGGRVNPYSSLWTTSICLRSSFYLLLALVEMETDTPQTRNDCARIDE